MLLQIVSRRPEQIRTIEETAQAVVTVGAKRFTNGTGCVVVVHRHPRTPGSTDSAALGKKRLIFRERHAVLTLDPRTTGDLDMTLAIRFVALSRLLPNRSPITLAVLTVV